MISGYEIRALNDKMDDLVETKGEFEAYLAFIDPIDKEREFVVQNISDLDIRIAETLAEIENYGGTYDFE